MCGLVRGVALRDLEGKHMVDLRELHLRGQQVGLADADSMKGGL